MTGLVQVVQKPLSTDGPSEKDIRSSEGLMALMNAECLIPSQDESDRRVKAIGKLNQLVGFGKFENLFSSLILCRRFAIL
jgi:poly(A) polymerase Pap1